MTKDEILSMALEFGWKSYSGPVNVVYSFNEKDIERFAALVAEKEREACAKVCDVFQARDVGMQPAECAGAIRARAKW